MLLTDMAEIYLIIILLCFTFAEPFDDIFLLRIGQRKYKQKFKTQGGKDRPTDQASKFALARLTLILHSAK